MSSFRRPGEERKKKSLRRQQSATLLKVEAERETALQRRMSIIRAWKALSADLDKFTASPATPMILRPEASGGHEEQSSGIVIILIKDVDNDVSRSHKVTIEANQSLQKALTAVNKMQETTHTGRKKD